ncbi:MAG: prephenate dehydrogenase [Elusimicrobiota bacterium]
MLPPIRVSIVGVGLIGGSLGAALRKVRSRSGGRRYRVAGIDSDARAVILAKKRGCVDAGGSRPTTALLRADIVVLATPPRAAVALLRGIWSRVSPGAVITDVASVKKGVMDAARGLALADRRAVSPCFIGGHPIAGSEKAGAPHARADLFSGAWCALFAAGVRRGRVAPRAKAAVERLWKDVGARPLWMTPEEHDEIVAWTSHLPHLLASAYMLSLRRLAGRRTRAGRLTGNAFRDFTRIAASEPRLWSEICACNGANLKPAIREFSATMDAFRKKGFPSGMFRRARRVRDALS